MIGEYDVTALMYKALPTFLLLASAVVIYRLPRWERWYRRRRKP